MRTLWGDAGRAAIALSFLYQSATGSPQEISSHMPRAEVGQEQPRSAVPSVSRESRPVSRADASSRPNTNALADDFVPADIAHAVAIACVVIGDAGPPPFAEAQVAVRYAGPAHSGDKLWDYKPIIARYTQQQGGVLAAIDDCNKWYSAVKKRIEEASRGEHAH